MPTLKIGSIGPEVAKVQEFLFKKNYFKEFLPLSQISPQNCITGTYDRDTAEAVSIWQARHLNGEGDGLLTDGEVGPITWEAMFSAAPVKKKTKPAPAIPSGKTLALKALAKAIGEIGVMEDPPGSNKGPRVTQYLSRAGYNNPEPWCCAYVYWCYDEVCNEEGIKNPLPKTGYCPTMYNGIKTKVDASDVRAGDIFFVQGPNRLNHIGFVVENLGDGWVSTVEGNTGFNGSREGVGVFARKRRVKGLVFARVVSS